MHHHLPNNSELIAHPKFPKLKTPPGFATLASKKFRFNLGDSILQLYDIQHNLHESSNDFIPTHSHPYYQFLYYLRGGGSLKARGKSIQIQPGQLLVLDKNVPHNYTGRMDLPAETFTMTFDLLPIPEEEADAVFDTDEGLSLENLLILMNDDGTPPSFIFHQYQRELLSSAIKEITSELLLGQPGHLLIVRAALLRLFAYFIRFAEDARVFRGSISIRDLRLHGLIQKVMAMIEENYYKPLSIEDIAASCAVCSSHLNVLFKKETHTTVYQYLLNVRMKKAKELLRAGAGNITEVAFQVGFNDSNYFSRMFKMRVSMSPREYINQVEKKQQQENGKID